jgi:hypothetical protein
VDPVPDPLIFFILVVPGIEPGPRYLYNICKLLVIILRQHNVAVIIRFILMLTKEESAKERKIYVKNINKLESN